MKHLLLNLLVLLVAAPAFASNTLHDKTEKASPTTSDEMYIWDVTSSSLKKATAGNLPVSTPTQAEIDTKEDALGNPASDGYVLSSTAAGVRSWIEMSGGSMSWPASDSVYYGAYNGAWVALTEVFQSPLVADTDYLTPSTAGSTYLAKTNITEFTPTGDYNPATKKYVDDNVAAGGMLESGSYTPTGTWDWTSATVTWPTFSYSDLSNQPTIPTASDTAYDATSWDGNTDVPTKNAVRDKIETLGSAFDPASPGAIGGTTPAAGTFTTVTAATYQSSAADGSRYSTLPNNTSAPSAATVVNGFYTYDNALYGVENSGTASLLLMVNDIGVSVQAYDADNATAGSTTTFTNKTLDVTGTGNAFTDTYDLPVTIISPADADDPLIDKTKRAVTLTGMDCVALGGGTISVDLQECDANGANCATTGATIASCGATNTNDASLTDTDIAANAYLMLVIGAPSGTVDQLSVKVYGTQVK